MKYIKMFESFDRYEFGEFTNPSEIFSKVGDIFQDTKDLEFTQYEKDEIRKIIPNYTIFMGKIDFERADNAKLIREFYRIYPLGYYCYALDKSYNEFNKDIMKYEKLWIIDDMDNLLDKLQEIVDELGLQSLYESVSRYDFGKYTSNTEIEAIFNSFQASGNYDDLGVFTKEYFDKLDNSFPPGGYYHKNKPHNTITFQINDKFYLVFALGDFCFAFFEEDKAQGNKWTYCEIIDDIDRLCSVIKEFVQASYSMNESIDRYEFRKYLPNNADLNELYYGNQSSNVPLSIYAADTISESDYTLIKKAIGGKLNATYCDSLKGRKYVTLQNRKITNIQFFIHYLGDYSYYLVKFDKSVNKFVSIEVIDQIETMLDVIKNMSII